MEKKKSTEKSRLITERLEENRTREIHFWRASNHQENASVERLLEAGFITWLAAEFSKI